MNQSLSCAGFVFMLMVGIVVKVFVRMCWFSVDISVEFSIFSCDDSVKECEFSVVFVFKSELYGWI